MWDRGTLAEVTILGESSDSKLQLQPCGLNTTILLLG